jgi:hypothetical protein
MRLVFRLVCLLALSLLLVPAGRADERATAKDKTKKSDTASAEATAETQPAAKSDSDSTTAPAAKKSAAAPPKARGANAASSETPAVFPMPGTSGTIGLFTVETGETLPAKGFSFSTYVNKFSRNPGSVSVLNFGTTFGVGITDWLNFFAWVEPRRHTHIGNPSELSLNTSPFDPVNHPAFPNNVNPTIYRRLCSTCRPGYVEDFPFAHANDGGVGEVTLGFKLGILSERRGHPVSLGVRNDFIFPTRSTLNDLLENGTQSGQFNYAITVSLSKTWGKLATLTGNAGYRFTRDPRVNGAHAMSQADQARVGAGLILFPESRAQLMQEYTGTIFTGTATPNTTFGARDPIDGVWGVRVYPWKGVAVDVGYRYMLNLQDVHDRHGFVAKLGVVSWPAKAKPNRPPVASCSADKTAVYAGSGDAVAVSVQASDPDGDPLTYSWTATGGRVEGTGPAVRWNSADTTPGVYTVTVKVDDGRGGTANCSVDIRVEPRPNRPPVSSGSAELAS